MMCFDFDLYAVAIEIDGTPESLFDALSVNPSRNVEADGNRVPCLSEKMLRNTHRGARSDNSDLAVPDTVSFCEAVTKLAWAKSPAAMPSTTSFSSIRLK